MSTTPINVSPEELLAQSEWARALARRLVGDASTADDLVQEALVKGLNRPPRTQPGDQRSLRAWLGRVVTNAARQRGRSEGRRARRERASARSEAVASSAELSERADGQRQLMEAVMRLDERARDVVLLRYFEGLSSAEIARQRGLPAGTVRWRLKSALDELRVHLDDGADGDRDRWLAALAPLCTGRRGVAVAVGSVPAALGLLAMKPIFIAASVVALALLGGSSILQSLGSRRAPELSAPRPEVAELDAEAATSTPIETSTPERSIEPGSALHQADVQAPVSAVDNKPPPRLSARFIDRHGNAVSGVTVLPWFNHSAVQSDALGRVEFDVEDQSLDGITLQFSHPEYANDTFSLATRIEGPTELGDIRLHAGGSIAGIVVTDTGEPLANATVQVEGAPEQKPSAAGIGGLSAWTMSGLGAATARTDATGRFRLDGVLAGSVDIQLGGIGDAMDGYRNDVEVQQGQLTEGVRLVAQGAPAERRIEGRVVTPDGTGVAYALLKLNYKSLFTNHTTGTATDADGRFLVAFDRRVNNIEIEVDDPKNRWSRLHLEGIESGTLDLVLRFKESRYMQLALESSSGNPLQEPRARIESVDGKREFNAVAPRDFVEHNCQLLVPNEPFMVIATATAHAELRLGPFDPSAELTAARGVLRELPGATVRVMANGKPLEGAEVGLYKRSKGKMYAGGFPTWIVPRPFISGTTDANGACRLGDGERSTFYIRAQASGYAATVVGPFKYRPDRGLETIELQLTAGGTLEGRLRVTGGSAAGYVVCASNGEGQPHVQYVADDGRYRFEHVAPGPWRVESMPRGWKRGGGTSTNGLAAVIDSIDANCDVREGETTVFDLRSGDEVGSAILDGNFDLRSLFPQGSLPSGWEVTLTPVGERPSTTAIDPVQLGNDGRFRFEQLETGTVRMLISNDRNQAPRFMAQLNLLPGPNDWSASFEVGALSIAGVDEQSERSGPLIAVVHCDGSDLIAAFELETSDVQTLTVPAGAVRIVSVGATGLGNEPAHWPHLAEVQVAAGESARLDL